MNEPFLIIRNCDGIIGSRPTEETAFEWANEKAKEVPGARVSVYAPGRSVLYRQVTTLVKDDDR